MIDWQSFHAMIDWQSFHFLRPAWLAAGLLCLPWAFLFLRRARRSGAWQRVCDAHLLKHLLVDGGGRARRWPALAASIAWLAACLALAGPAWERLPQPAVDLAEQRVLVLSLAPSMAARDVAPSRVARARFALHDALDALPDAAFGLVVYAEEPYAVTPLTDDADVVESVLPVLDPSIMPGRGARLDRAIDEARALLEGAGAAHGRIVVVTDGPGEVPQAAEQAAARAAAAGFQVGVLGIGPAAADALGAIARAGGGSYVAAGVGPESAAAVVGSGATSLLGAETTAREDVHVDAWRDAGRALLWLPLLLAPLAFRRGWAGALGLAALLLVQSAPARADGLADWFARPDQQGARAFAAGDHAEAAELFQDPDWRAAALYRNGDFAGAVQALQGRDDPESTYNRGNGLARSGQLEAALAAYEQVLEADPDHADARFNRDLVKKLLELQKQQKKQQQQPQSQQQQQQQQQDQGGAGDSSQADEPGSDGKASQDSGSDSSGKGDSPDASKSEESDSGSGSAQAADASQDPSGEESGAEDGSDAKSQLASAGSDASKPNPDEPNAEASEPNGSDGAGTAADEAPGAAAPAPGRTEVGELPPSETPQVAGAAASEQPLSESEQSEEQWLRRVPDDPAGLLREKLRRRYAEKRYLGGSR